jgi:hypothetical protein
LEDNRKLLEATREWINLKKDKKDYDAEINGKIKAKELEIAALAKQTEN